MPLNKVQSEYPCFWFAKYPINKKEIVIPKCSICNNYLKQSGNKYICCTTDCNPTANDINFAESKIIKLDEGELYEFDYFGNQTISFRYLPIDDVEIFGIANAHPNKNEIYSINLMNGRYSINGVILKPSVYVNKEEFIVSDKLKRYGQNNDLIHYKSAVAIPGRPTQIKNFNIGYKCKIYNLNIQTILSIHSDDFTPSLYAKYSEN